MKGFNFFVLVLFLVFFWLFVGRLSFSGGSSMFRSWRGNSVDFVFFVDRDFRVGDVVVYRSFLGFEIMHRVVGRVSNGFLVCGDFGGFCEVVGEEKIIGKGFKIVDGW